MRAVENVWRNYGQLPTRAIAWVVDMTDALLAVLTRRLRAVKRGRRDEPAYYARRRLEAVGRTPP